MKIFSTYLSSIDSLSRLDSRKHYIFKPYYDFSDPYKVVDRQPEYEVELNASYTNIQNTSINDINVTSTGIDMPRFSIDNLMKKREFTDYVIVDSTFVDANIITYPTDTKIPLSSTLIDSEIDIDILHFNTAPTSYDITTKESFKRGSSYRKIKIPYQKSTNESSKYIVIDDNYYVPKVNNVIIHDLKSLNMELISGNVTDILEKHKPNVIGYSIPKPKVKVSTTIDNYANIDGIEVLLKVVTDIGQITTDVMFFEENSIELSTKEVLLKDVRDLDKFATYNLSDTLRVTRPSTNKTKTYNRNFVVKLVSGAKTLVNFQDDTIEVPTTLGLGVYDDLQLTNGITSIERDYYSKSINKLYPQSGSKRGLLVVKNDGSYVVTDDFNEMSLDSNLQSSFATFNTTTTKRWNEFNTRLAVIPSFYKSTSQKDLHTHTYTTVINGAVYVKSEILGNVEVFSPAFRKYKGLPTHFFTKPSLFGDNELHYTNDFRSGYINGVYNHSSRLSEVSLGHIELEKYHTSSLKYLSKPYDIVGNIFTTSIKYPKKITDEIGLLERDRLVYVPKFVADLLSGDYAEISVGTNALINGLYESKYLSSDLFNGRLFESLSSYAKINKVYRKDNLFDATLFRDDIVSNPVKSKVYIKNELYSELLPTVIDERNRPISSKVLPVRDIFNEVGFTHFEVGGFTQGKIFESPLFTDVIPVNINLTSHNVTKIFGSTSSYDRATRYDLKYILPKIPGLVSKVYNSSTRYDTADLIEKILLERESANIKFEKLYTRDIWSSVVGTQLYVKGVSIPSFSSRDIFADLRPSKIELVSHISGLYTKLVFVGIEPTGVNLTNHIESVLYTNSSKIPKSPAISIEQKNTIEDRVYNRPIKLSLVPNLIDSLHRGIDKVYSKGNDTKLGTGINITSTIDEFVGGSYLTDVIGNSFSSRMSITGDMYVKNESKLEYTSPYNMMTVREESKDKPLRIQYDATRQERDIVAGFDGKIYLDSYSTILSEITGFTDRSPDRHTFNYAIDSSKLKGLPTYKWDTLALVDTIYGKTDKLHLGSTPLPNLFSQGIYKFIEPRYAKLERPQGVSSYTQSITGLVYNGYLQRQQHTELTLDLNVGIDGRIFNEYLKRADNSDRTITLSTSIKELYNNSFNIKVDSLRLNDIKDTIIPVNRRPFNPSIKYNDVALGKKLQSQPSYIGVKHSYDIEIGHSFVNVSSFDREITLKNFDSSRIREIYSARPELYRDITTSDLNGLNLASPIRYNKSLDEFNRDYPTTVAVGGVSYNNYFNVEKSYNIDISYDNKLNYNSDYSRDIKYVLDLGLPGPSLIYNNYSRLELFSREGYEDSRVFRYDNYSQKEQYERMFSPSRIKIPYTVEKPLFREVSSLYEDIEFGLFKYDNYSRLELYDRFDYTDSRVFRYDNYSNLSVYDRALDGVRASIAYKVDRYRLDLHSRHIESPRGVLRYDNDLSKYKAVESYSLDLDLRSINSNYNRLSINDREDRVAYTLSGSIYDSYNVKKESNKLNYLDTHTLKYEKPFDKGVVNQSIVTRIERPYEVTSYVGVENHHIQIESFSNDRFYTKDIYESQYPSYDVKLPVKFGKNSYVTLPSIVSNTNDVKYNKEVKLYNKPFEGNVSRIDTSYGIEQLYTSDFTRDMSVNDISYNLTVGKIYPSVSRDKLALHYDSTKVALDKLYTSQYFDNVTNTGSIKVGINKLYDNLYVANVKGLSHNPSAKVTVKSLYDNLYVANVKSLVHNFNVVDSDSELVKKLGVYNKYNYNFDQLTDLYARPSVSLYDKPFLKWIPRWYNESRQSYDVFESNVNLRTIDGYKFILPIVDYSIDLSIDRVRYNKPFTTNDISVQSLAYRPFRYDNELSKYDHSYPGVTVDSPVLYSKNYLTYSSSNIERPVDLATFRYDNNVNYTSSYELNVSTVKSNNYLIKTIISDVVSTPSYVELRYNNNLDSYNSKSIDVKIGRPTTNYLPKVEYVVEVMTAEFRYNNDLSKYKSSLSVATTDRVEVSYLPKVIDGLSASVDMSTFRYDNELDSYVDNYNVQSTVIFRAKRAFSNISVEQTKDVSTFRYENDLEDFVPAYDVKVQQVRQNNYLSSIEVSLTNETYNDNYLRYDNGLDKYNSTSIELKTNDTIEKATYNSQKEVYKQFNKTDLSRFGYESIKKESFKRSVVINDASVPTLTSPSYNRIQHKSFDYKSTNAPDLRVSASFNKILDTTLGHNFKPNIATVNNLFAKKEILSGIDKSKFSYSSNSVKGALYTGGNSAISDRKFIMNRTIQPLTYGTDRIHRRIVTERLTPIYKGEFKYTDIETRFVLRGPVNYDMYGDSVKVVMMEQNKQGFVWEQQIDTTAYKSKNLLQQESAYVYKKEPIVVASSPVLTRENQIEYYFGGQGKLKMEKISGTYTNPDGEYPLAAPINCTVKGIMRPTTSVAIQHIVEYDYDKIDEVNVVPVFNETGDRVSLFSDRFFLQ